MYCPAAFREERLDVMHALMRAHPLATLVTAGAGGLRVNLLPFSLAEDGGKGVLRAHLARANDQVAALREGAPALLVFQGPQAYVAPAWYPSKAEHGKVVPTWNYAAVEVRGTPRVIDDPSWVRAQIEALTAQQEQGRPDPWQVPDAPGAFIDGLLKVLVGVEIPIGHIEGKWKVSQNRSTADRQGVAQGLRREGVSEAMARLVDPA
ncbi:FMN-binding negative transcriptional regulator [Azohydromonas caseinilytica]|uniref:FMN-binding negative transcriptional regulator n=1 Tax=Azohydromonas caseinilytica TaxID=2728836 RepID=A0A848FCL4_9BURK|nr:FMN-binding negative transcriptional regulator [Azohydromonas caseinilytica]NML16033.1 FMN-binding negative transcriptional regulator [Azohydromonas caseinilytica]